MVLHLPEETSPLMGKPLIKIPSWTGDSIQFKG